jgi:hypothetical protein
MNELPDWNYPFVDNYTGPFWSDGKVQKSVANGKSRSKSKVDVLSRKHDAEYFYCRSDDCFDLADMDYYQATRDMSFVPRMIGDAVLYVNRAARHPNLRGSGGVKMSMGEMIYMPTLVAGGTQKNVGGQVIPGFNISSLNPRIPAVMPPRADATPVVPKPLSNPPSVTYPAKPAVDVPIGTPAAKVTSGTPVMSVEQKVGQALNALNGSQYTTAGIRSSRNSLIDFFDPSESNSGFFGTLFGDRRGRRKYKNKNKNRVFVT